MIKSFKKVLSGREKKGGQMTVSWDGMRELMLSSTVKSKEV